jgi:hypothetical protein
MFCIILILCFFVVNLVSVYYLKVPVFVKKCDFGMGEFNPSAFVFSALNLLLRVNEIHCLFFHLLT